MWFSYNNTAHNLFIYWQFYLTVICQQLQFLCLFLDLAYSMWSVLHTSPCEHRQHNTTVSAVLLWNINPYLLRFVYVSCSPMGTVQIYCDFSATEEENLVVISDYPCRDISEPMFKMGEKLKVLAQWVPFRYKYLKFSFIIILYVSDITGFICIKLVCFTSMSCAGKPVGGKSALCKLELRTTSQIIMWQRSIMGVYTSKLPSFQCQRTPLSKKIPGC